MRNKPLIGVNSDYREANGNRPAYCLLCAGYVDRIMAAGGIPIVVPPLEDNEDLQSVLDQFDGFLLIGGPDLDPEHDGFMRHPSVRPMGPRREQFDRMLMRMIAERQIPVFGIGVGMQLMNISCGGSLYFHLPEDLPKSLPHKDQLDVNHRHGLEVAAGSLMERVYGDGEVRVNSMHHMAVDRLAPGFAVTGMSPDGVVEAIESQSEGWLAIGTQFHPESSSASALDQRIFDEFLAGITGRVPEVRLVA